MPVGSAIPLKGSSRKYVTMVLVFLGRPHRNFGKTPYFSNFRNVNDTVPTLLVTVSSRGFFCSGLVLVGFHDANEIKIKYYALYVTQQAAGSDPLPLASLPYQCHVTLLSARLHPTRMRYVFYGRPLSSQSTSWTIISLHSQLLGPTPPPILSGLGLPELGP